MAVVINGNGNITGLDGVFSADSVNTLVDTRIDSDSFVELTGNQTIAGIKTFSDSANFTGGHLRVYNSADSEEQVIVAEVSGGYSNGAGVSLRRDGVEMGRVNADYFDGMTFYVTDGAGGAATQKARLSTAGTFVIGENETPYNLFSVRDSDMGFEVNPNASKEVRLNAYDRGNSVYKTMALQANPVVIRPGGANGVDYTTIDADGIKFNGDTAAANALDDYEEGTWTPTVTTRSGSITVYNCRYVKVGAHVTVHGYFYWVSNDTNNNSNQFFIGGLPYTLAGSNHYVAGSVGWSSGVDITDYYMLGLTGSTSLYFTKTTPSVNVTNAEIHTKGLVQLILSMSYISDA